MLKPSVGMALQPDLPPDFQAAAAAEAGPLWSQWFRRKISLALTLSAVIPVLLLGYSIFGALMSWLGQDPFFGHDALWGQTLLAFTGLLMSAGGLVIWDLASIVRRTVETVAATRGVESAVAEKTDQIGVLMGSFSRVLSTIETQTGEINQFATRLDAAYRELEATNARLEEVSFKDEVTRLYNRRFFSIRLEEEVARFRRFHHPMSLVLLDLDGFKEINDDLGHAAGDATLREVSELLLKHSRGVNVICRYGGDEFAILLVETPKAGAQIYADRIRHVLVEHPFAHGRLSASFGIAALPDDVGAAAEDMIRAADEALYAAKRAGKNRVSILRPAAPSPGEEPVVMPAIAGGSDASLPDAAPVGLAAAESVSALEFGARSVVVLNEGVNVREALQGLAAATYDLILRPAPLRSFAGLTSADLRRSAEIHLMPSGLPPLSRSERATLIALHDLIAARDTGTGSHSERVRVYAMCLARAHRMSEADLRDLEYGVILHDIGKIGIPDSILLKPGPLTPEEWKVMRTHPEVGRRLVENIPFLAGAVPIVYHHHERWDGHGYPEGLSGERIPLGARIFAVADALDAMTYDRPYSRAVTLEAARAEISRCAGTHFDPAVVDTFLTIPLSTLEELRRRATS